MNCPHHIQLFSRKPWSYKELPVRYMENTTNYRDEKSGELHGLSRVRSLSQDDGHIFCREEDIEAELTNLVRMVKELYQTLGMSFYARLSYRDELDKYLGEGDSWKKAETLIAQIAKTEELETIDGIGEAAFYGPKIDFMVRDAIGREWQCATIQLDFVQPERFKLFYTADDGTDKRPVLIHKALLGAIERFLSVYIEHTAGKFPVWLAPEQLRIASVNQEEATLAFVGALAAKALAMDLRVGIDNANESVGKKIRTAETMKVPYTLVIGQKEIESGKLSPRVRADLSTKNEQNSLSIDNFLELVAKEAKSRTGKSSI